MYGMKIYRLHFIEKVFRLRTINRQLTVQNKNNKLIRDKTLKNSLQVVVFKKEILRSNL